MPNRLALEASPYLRQHQDNPVDWYPWGDEAFALAREADRPIFLSVGYSTCHWCHVMERESFEDAAIARLLAEKFVSIKVDREERPDVDRLYMAYVQATTGGGGWPMPVFLTPSLRPFFGGTYFPPDHFAALLGKIAELWRTRRADLEASGAHMLAELERAERPAPPVPLGPEVLEEGRRAFAGQFDPDHGGFGGRPKFPRPVVLDFLFHTGAPDAVDMALTTLRHMARGGLRDHLGGGFHRYSVDATWHVPHFEKMLYDQAQLVCAYLTGYQLGGGDELARVARATCDYVLGDLASPEGAFFSAEDADSLAPGGAERVEGAFYVWTQAEIRATLGAEAAAWFSRKYDVQARGNADDPHGDLLGKNVLHEVLGDDELAADVGRPPKEVQAALAGARTELLATRARRPRPRRDDKILTAWNGMMIGALARAAQVLDEPRYLAAAERAARFVTERHWDAGRDELLRRSVAGIPEARPIPAYLDDHAQLAAGLLELFQAGQDLHWLDVAEAVTERMIARFVDERDGSLFAAADDPSLILRLKDDHDGAEPAPSSVAALVLLALADLLDRPTWRALAERILATRSALLEAAPHALPHLLTALDRARRGLVQIVIATDSRADPAAQALVRAVNQRWVPHRMLIVVDAETRRRLPHLAAMTPVQGRPTAYVCRKWTCQAPVTDAQSVIDLLPSLGAT